MKRFIALIIVLLALIPAAVFGDSEPPEIEVQTVVESTPLEKFLVTTSVINQKEIDSDPSLDMGELFEPVTGVLTRGVANQKARNEIFIRGFDMSHLRVYFNGIPINTPNNRIVDFSIIPKEFIRKVEVVKGPPPVSYGADASGGIINLVSRDGKDSPGFMAKVLAGSFGESMYTLTAGLHDKNYDLFIMGKEDISGGYTENTARNMDYALLSGNVNMGKNYKASILYSRSGGDKQFPNEYTPGGKFQVHTTGFWSGSYNWSYQGILQESGSIRLEKKNPEGLSWAVMAYNHVDNNVLTGWVDAGYPIKPGPGKTGQYYQAGVTNYSYWESRDSGGNIDFDFKSANHNFKFGASAENVRFRQNENASLSRPQNEWDKDYWSPYSSIGYGGYYLQDDIKLGKKLTLTAGGRADSDTRTASIGNWNLNFVFENGKETYRLGGATTGRFPTVSELEGKKGNPNLQPERATSYEIGYNRKSGENVFDLSVFDSDIKNLIGTQTSDSKYANWLEVKLFGFEASYQFPVSKSVFSRAGVQYVNRNFGDQPPVWDDIPKNKYTLAFFSKQKSGNINWKIEAYAVSSKQTGDATYPTLDGYTLTNLMLSYNTPEKEKSKASHELSLIVRNVFDVKYSDTLYYLEPGRGIWGEYSIKL
ncbi:MAG: TonB-dependent receptor [Chloroflexi bacterium]|nr:TonB-dependent receptor [Chloroflexota bacterium]